MKYSLREIVRCGLSMAAAAMFAGFMMAQGQENAAPAARFSGTVIETTNAASYTYVRIDTGKEKVWAAAPQFAVKVGDKVSFDNGMAMPNFQSKALNRTFDTVYFVGKVDMAGASPAPAGTATVPSSQSMPNDDVHAGMRRPAAAVANPPAKIDFAGIKKAEGGLTVAEVYSQKAKLEKKEVTFRGKVVKYNAQVMNKNWAHVQDGTGTTGSNDITVTTEDTAQVGDTVLVRGTVALNKDFGYGYKYGLVVENAKVTPENAK